MSMIKHDAQVLALKAPKSGAKLHGSIGKALDRPGREYLVQLGYTQNSIY